MVGELSPFELHTSLFLVTLRVQCNIEQSKLFLEKAQQWQYIGCYAQTELGHGSNLRGLETTATWNGTFKTFVIHSPSLTAAKWWIGGAGVVANHAVVMAQLVIGTTSYGPHLFMVPIRDIDTHELLPGVFAGDVGPKFGCNTNDNGFLLFNNVSIPHINMLARYSYVDASTGKYIKTGPPFNAYRTLTFVRSIIVERAGTILAKGVTIAIRYSAVRCQFTDPSDPEGVEMQVLDYRTVQFRLLTLLASAYALHFTGRRMIESYWSLSDSEGANDEGNASPRSMDAAADLHALSSSLKVLASTMTADGLDTCRRACGGHGYSSFAALGNMYADYVPTTNWEGDNYMLPQQVARYLLKSAGLTPVRTPGLHVVSQLLSHWRHKDVAHGFDLTDSDAIVEYFAVTSFSDAIEEAARAQRLPVEDTTILRQLFHLFTLTIIDKRRTDFVSSQAMGMIELERLSDTICILMSELRPHAVSLTDAWDFSDWELDSSLRRSDGKVYEDLFTRATYLNPIGSILIDSCSDDSGDRWIVFAMIRKITT